MYLDKLFSAASARYSDAFGKLLRFQTTNSHWLFNQAEMVFVGHAHTSHTILTDICVA